MVTQALYRRWRSQTFNEVIGQHHVTQTLQNAIETDRVAHAYLFTGPRGTGKTSTARILAKAINCTGGGEKPCNACSICVAVTEGRLMDLIEIDAASNTSVDDIRDLREKVGFRPGEAQTKFYIIDEVHMLSKSAFNALLKTLEEPPPHVIFVLATTEPEKIPATITSRCQRFDFRRIKVDDVAQRLKFIVEQEGLDAEADALTFIARQGGGSMRDAISLLDQLTAYGGDTITLDLVHSVLGTTNTSSTKALVDCLLNDDPAEGLKLINEAMNNGVEPRQFTLEILEYLRGLLLLKHGQREQVLNLPQEMIEAMQTQAGGASAAKLLRMTERFNEAVYGFKNSNDVIPQLPLELALVDLTTAPPQPTPVQVQVPAAQKPPATVSAPPVKQLQAQSTQAVQASKPPPQAKQPAPQSPASSVESLTKEELRGFWPQIMAELRRHNVSYQQYFTREAMADIDIQGRKIIILFSPNFHKAKDRAEVHKEIVADAFQHVLGKKWLVEFTVAAKASPGNTALAPAAPPILSGSPEDDELVQEALKLGGQIKD